MSNYELPTFYNKRSAGFADSDSEEEVVIDNNKYSNKIATSTSVLPSRSNYKDVHVEDSRLAWLLLTTSFFILLLTVVPVVTDIPNISPWFPGDALWRFFDPIITLPLNLFIITRADIMTNGRINYWGALSEASVVWLFWSFGAALYVQFHGVHTAAAMFKHPVQDFNLAHPDLVQQYPILYDIYSNMRDLWEHIIAHYLYAAGAMMMSWVQLFAFRNQVHGPLPTTTKVVWCIGIIFYGLLLGAVSINFPEGLIVGLVYSSVIGLICISMMVFNQRNLPRGGLLTMGKRMVLQFYLGACVIGLVIIIVWIGIFGFANRLAAGVAV